MLFHQLTNEEKSRYVIILIQEKKPHQLGRLFVNGHFNESSVREGNLFSMRSRGQLFPVFAAAADSFPGKGTTLVFPMVAVVVWEHEALT